MEQEEIIIGFPERKPLPHSGQPDAPSTPL
jgi:hypothetical protein